MVEVTKKSSSKWIKEQGALFSNFYWQGGYGAFSVSQSNVEQVRSYVLSWRGKIHFAISSRIYHLGMPSRYIPSFFPLLLPVLHGVRGAT